MYKILVAGPEEIFPGCPIDVNAETVDFFTTDKSQCFNSLNPADVASCDGVIVPGGVPDVSPSFWNEEIAGSHDVDVDMDRKQLAMIDQAVQLHKPILGICRGHQLACVYFGATLIQDIKTGDHHRYVPGEPRFHRIYNIPGTFMHDLYGDSFKGNSGHHQALRKIPDCLRVTQLWCQDDQLDKYIQMAQEGTLREGTDECIIEGVYHTDYPFIGIQWHPELRGEMYCKRIDLL
ncbi:MAG: gamma-glutamyl-gamma-aminobutyrate hydrolase family protein, partial [Lachnospiraceae bacterium]|nr:gamma-glutamyl-gamma-aminobutyrate hydrolase family protein [Lachnospiraceae bacterium]